jgi:hypothetical protein
MNNKKLFIVLVALLAVYFGYTLLSGDKERSFKSELIKVNTEEVTQILLFPKAENYEKVTLTRSENDWQVSKADFTAKATKDAVSNLLNEIKSVKAKRVAAKNPNKWASYEVDSTGNSVQVFEGDKLVADFIVGKFDMNQQTRTFTSFIRLNDENNIYAVDGFLSMTFNQNMDAFRDKKLVNFNTQDITEFSINTEAGSQTYSKLVGNWSTTEGIILDSTKVATYLNGVSNLNGKDFINDFSAATPSKSVIFKGNNISTPIIVNCYDHVGEKPFVFHSNLNEEAYFLSDSSGIFATLFKTTEEFLSGAEE